MRVLIIGAGAIGSLLGHRLARAGQEVTLVGRTKFVAAVQERGLGLEEPAGQTFIHNVHNVRVTTGVDDIIVPSVAGGKAAETWPDLIIFTMKAYDAAEAARQVAPLVTHGIPLLVVQNGVGGEELAAQALQGIPVTIFSAVITLSVEVIEPGWVHLATTRGGLSLAPTGPSAGGPPPLAAYAEMFRQAGFRVATFSDHRPVKWSKLLLNMIGNALPAIVGWSPDRVFADPRLFALERRAFREAVTVMRAAGMRPVALPGYPVPLLAWGIYSLPESILRPLFQRFIVGSRGGKMPSLYLDLAHRKGKSEVAFLNGAVVRQGQTVGVETPVNQALYTTLMDIVEGRTPWEAFRDRPEEILAVAGFRGTG